jgi:hypothetical protein
VRKGGPKEGRNETPAYLLSGNGEERADDATIATLSAMQAFHLNHKTRIEYYILFLFVK